MTEDSKDPFTRPLVGRRLAVNEKPVVIIAIFWSWNLVLHKPFIYWKARPHVRKSRYGMVLANKHYGMLHAPKVEVVCPLPVNGLPIPQHLQIGVGHNKDRAHTSSCKKMTNKSMEAKLFQRETLLQGVSWPKV